LENPNLQTLQPEEGSKTAAAACWVTAACLKHECGHSAHTCCVILLTGNLPGDQRAAAERIVGFLNSNLPQTLKPDKEGSRTRGSCVLEGAG
jgi:hypothetical protein